MRSSTSAAVARNGSAIAICGRSGAGKSTFAAALCRAGCDFVTDDLCVVSLDDARRPVVAPDGRQLKLWRESMETLDLTERRGPAVRDGFEKYFIEPPQVVRSPPRLTAVYLLRDGLPNREDVLEPLAQPDAMRMLDFETYRPMLRAKLGSRPALLARGAAMLRHAKVFRFFRRRGFERLDETVTMLLEHWERLEA